MSRMDYVIICRVIELLNECGMTDEELSFLLGKANNYVFGFIAKPSDKNRFTEDQLDLLPYLLSCTFRQLIPNDTKPGDIHLYHTKRIDDDPKHVDNAYKGFSHIIYDATGKGTRIIWRKKKAAKGSFRKTNDTLLKLLTDWINDGYFDTQQTALEIYKKARGNSRAGAFRVDELEKCLKALCGSRFQVLEKKPVEGLLRYWKRKK